MQVHSICDCGKEIAMSILDKFAAVEVKNDDRISATDKRFCEIQQEAYNTARESLQELKTFWSGIVAAQQEIFYDLPKDDRSSYTHLTYIGAIKNLSAADICKVIEDSHSTLIEQIVYHFNSTYNVSVSKSEVEEHLLPPEPTERGWRHNTEQLTQYHGSLQALVLQYNDILDQIFIQLGGRSFADRALDELKEKCHKAAWNSYRQTADFEVKKDVIRFSSYACKYSDWCSRGEWELQDSTKNILRGIAHFETDSFHSIPYGFSNLLGWGGVKDSIIEFSTCDKVVQLKMFKNNRVDIKFASALLAKQFSEEYLGLVC